MIDSEVQLNFGVTVHTCPKSRTAANCNGIQPIGSSPAAKGWMPGKPHSLALFRQQVPEQGVNSNYIFAIKAAISSELITCLGSDKSIISSFFRDSGSDNNSVFAIRAAISSELIT